MKLSRIAISLLSFALALGGARVLGGGVVFEGPAGDGPAATNRFIRVWVPPGYETNTTVRFPVLYIQDGQHVLSTAGTNAAAGWGGWGLDLVAESLIVSNRMAPVILVAVDSTAQRSLEYRGPAHEYDPAELKAERPRPVRPGDDSAYEGYRRFLIEELKPRIDREYRTLTNAASTGVLGASLGGLCSLALALDRPDVFTRVACLSGTFQIEREEFLTRLRRRTNAPSGMRVYLDSGIVDLQGGDDNRVRAEAIATEFRRLGWRDGRDFLRYTDYLLLSPRQLMLSGVRKQKWDEGKRSQHNEFYWRMRAWRALEYLFPSSLPPVPPKPRTK